MPARTRFIIAVIVLGLLMTGPFVLTAALIWLGTQGAERDTLLQVIVPHLPLGTLVTATGFAFGVVVVRNLFRQYVKGLDRLGEQLRLMLSANRNFRVKPSGPPEVRAVVSVANELARQRDERMDDVEAQIERAKGRVEEEKNRLAALMSELTQSVVVCARVPSSARSRRRRGWPVAAS
jgi:DNA polymerase-3 subunit epsilon